jgi:protease II
MKLTEVINFFRDNNCTIDIYENKNNDFYFNLYNKESERWILTDANEFMLREFYLKCIN